MATGKKHYLIRARQIKNYADLLPLKTYAKKQFVDESTVRNWISQRRIVGYKIKGRWWIDPESRFRVPLYDGDPNRFGI
jgi:hypothetical protein